MKSVIITTGLLLVFGNTWAQATKKITQSEMNKTIVKNLYEECMNKRKFSDLKNFIAEDFTGTTGAKGVKAFETPLSLVLTAVPDAQWNITDILADGDKVMVKWRLEGTNTGQFQVFKPSGNTVSNEGIGIFELRGGKIIKGNVSTDRIGFLQQIGALPLDISTLATQNPDAAHFIDKFIVPQQARDEFMKRVSINRNFIKTLPGFIKDAAYESTDGDGNILFVTMASWKNENAVKEAKEKVQAKYKEEGFDLSEFLTRNQIKIERGLYKAAQ